MLRSDAFRGLINCKLTELTNRSAPFFYFLRFSIRPEWITGGLGVLALAQIAPIPYFGFGFIAAGLLGVYGAFPAAALAGLALDLAQVTPVPMTAALVLAYLIRLLPGKLGDPAITREYLSYLDVLVDGPFVEAKKNLSLRFRGSENQRLIDVPASLAAGKIVLWQDWQGEKKGMK